MVGTIGIALSGLQAATNRLNASASNIANLQTTGSLNDPSRAPFTPVTSTQTAQSEGGVRSKIIPRNAPFTPSFAPGSPFADQNGIIGAPNINLAEEVVNLNLAELEFKANLATFETADALTEELLNIFDDEA